MKKIISLLLVFCMMFILTTGSYIYGNDNIPSPSPRFACQCGGARFTIVYDELVGYDEDGHNIRSTTVDTCSNPLCSQIPVYFPSTTEKKPHTLVDRSTNFKRHSNGRDYYTRTQHCTYVGPTDNEKCGYTYVTAEFSVPCNGSSSCGQLAIQSIEGDTHHTE